MAKGNTIRQEVTQVNGLYQKLIDYALLVKMRLSLTVVFSSVMAYLIASTGKASWEGVIVLGLGGFFVTGAANALNQVLEKDFDALMQRTSNRPLAAGRMTVSQAVLFAGIISSIGFILLALFNPLTAFFGILAFISYAFLYTPLKRVSSVAVLVGAVPGALPTLIGCVAAEGTLTTLGISLFCLQFIWQFPHFWAIGFLGFDEYQKAGYHLIPVESGKPDRRIAIQALLYALALMPIGLIPYLLGVTGVISAVILVVSSLIFAFAAWQFYKSFDRKSALRLMFSSLLYLPTILIVLFLDKI